MIFATVWHIVLPYRSILEDLFTIAFKEKTSRAPIFIDSTVYHLTYLTSISNCRYRKVYNKRTDNWYPVAVKEPKSYCYIPVLMVDIMKRRQVTEQSSLVHPWPLDEDHPKRIAPNIAKTVGPPTHVLVEQHKSRMEARYTKIWKLWKDYQIMFWDVI